MTITSVDVAKNNYLELSCPSGNLGKDISSYDKITLLEFLDNKFMCLFKDQLDHCFGPTCTTNKWPNWSKVVQLAQIGHKITHGFVIEKFQKGKFLGGQ